MGRRRKTDKQLPQRLYLVHGSYWFRPKVGKPQNFGRDLGVALAKYGQVIGPTWTGRTLWDVIDRYRIEVLPLKRSKATQKNEAAALDRWKRWGGHMRPDNITKPDLYRYIDERRKEGGLPAPEAARHEIGLLRHVFKKAIRWGVGTHDPFLGMEKFKRKGKRAAVPMSQVDAVRALANPRMLLAIDFAVCMGPRRGDLLTLTRDNETDAGILFTASKTQRAQLIEWTPALRDIVARCKAMAPQLGSRYLLRTRTGDPYTPAGFSANWQRLINKHVAAGGQRFTFHDLRSVAADAAETVEEARDLLGHASSDTTDKTYRRGPQKGRPAK
jgi:integrase